LKVTASDMKSPLGPLLWRFCGNCGEESDFAEAGTMHAAKFK